MPSTASPRRGQQSQLDLTVEAWRHGQSPRQRRCNQQTIGSDPLVGLFPFLERAAKRTALPVLIPETVVYEHHFPRGWYWCETNDPAERRRKRQDSLRAGGGVPPPPQQQQQQQRGPRGARGLLQRQRSRKQSPCAGCPGLTVPPQLQTKAVRECETKAILESFQSGLRSGQEVVAQVVHRPEGDEGRQSGICVDFLDLDGLKRFLMKLPDQCILSKYIAPQKGNAEERLHAVWTPQAVLVERLRHTGAALQSADGGDPASSCVVLCPPALRVRCEEAVARLVQLVQDLEKMRVIEFECDFKLDRVTAPPARRGDQKGETRDQGRLVLLWVTRLWLIHEPLVPPELAHSGKGSSRATMRTCDTLPERALVDASVLSHLRLSRLTNRPSDWKKQQGRPAARSQQQLQQQQPQLQLSAASAGRSQVRSIRSPGLLVSGSSETPQAEVTNAKPLPLPAGPSPTKDRGATPQSAPGGAASPGQQAALMSPVPRPLTSHRRRRLRVSRFPLTRVGVRMPRPAGTEGGWPSFCLPEPPSAEAVRGARQYFEQAVEAEIRKALRAAAVRRGMERLKKRQCDLRDSVSPRQGSPARGGREASPSPKESDKQRAGNALLTRLPRARFQGQIDVRAEFPSEPYDIDPAVATASPCGTPPPTRAPSPAQSGSPRLSIWNRSPRRLSVSPMASSPGRDVDVIDSDGGCDDQVLESLRRLGDTMRGSLPRRYCPRGARRSGPSRAAQELRERNRGRCIPGASASQRDGVSYLALARELGITLSLSEHTEYELTEGSSGPEPDELACSGLGSPDASPQKSPASPQRQSPAASSFGRSLARRHRQRPAKIGKDVQPPSAARAARKGEEDPVKGREEERVTLVGLLAMRRRQEYEEMREQHQGVRDALRDLEYAAYMHALEHHASGSGSSSVFSFDLPPDCPHIPYIAELQLERTRYILEELRENITTAPSGGLGEFCLRLNPGDPALLVTRQVMKTLAEKVAGLMHLNEVSLLLKDLDMATIRTLKYHKIPARGLTEGRSVMQRRVSSKRDMAPRKISRAGLRASRRQSSVDPLAGSGLHSPLPRSPLSPPACLTPRSNPSLSGSLGARPDFTRSPSCQGQPRAGRRPSALKFELSPQQQEHDKKRRDKRAESVLAQQRAALGLGCTGLLTLRQTQEERSSPRRASAAPPEPLLTVHRGVLALSTSGIGMSPEAILHQDLDGAETARDFDSASEEPDSPVLDLFAGHSPALAADEQAHIRRGFGT
eukprot:TRINITY_DN2338_c0_g1_i1.p1 TRINITY_DN2338_c0_g1~~TRINITY_DN2338_c0_g1_i1.p1  ORF type:complete len:1271 (+),score=327.82 TRINITY_DN2338_c0_g1_i1:66-3815(+)